MLPSFSHLNIATPKIPDDAEYICHTLTTIKKHAQHNRTRKALLANAAKLKLGINE